MNAEERASGQSQGGGDLPPRSSVAAVPVYEPLMNVDRDALDRSAV
jgi:hypothetical protein